MSDYPQLFIKKYTYNNGYFCTNNPISLYEILWYFNIPHNDMIKHFKKTMEFHRIKKNNYYTYSFHSLTEEQMSIIIDELKLYFTKKIN